MVCPDALTVSMPLVQVLLICGGLAGGAIVAVWREGVAVARDLAAARVEIADMSRRLDVLESRKDD